MSAWQTLKSEVVYETPWIKVRRDEVLNQNSKPLTYSVIQLQHPSVFIIAVNDEGKVLLQKNYRYTIDQMVWELPAGHSDGQDALTAAQRELLEEDGLISNDWTKLGRLYQAIGTGSMPLDIYLACNAKQSQDSTPDETELIEERRFFSIAEIDSMIQNGELINAADIGAFQLAKLHGLNNKEKNNG